jgi:hypothetical protein
MVANAPQQGSSPAGDAASRLEQLADVATQLELTALSAEAKAFSKRVAGGLFYVACVGQFKRGKSSLLNALASGARLPTGVVPVTSVVTIVRYGRERHAEIHLRSGDPKRIALDDLPLYVTETENPRNAKGVAVAEVFVPSELLASGMCLVDTPGIGSVSIENTAATKAFVPHVDAALVVLGSDPPISADEIALVESVARQTTELIFVLSKADRGVEAERREASAFCETVLAERLGRLISPLLEVSATEQLTGSGPPRDWPRLVSWLTNLAKSAGSDLVHAAAERGARVLGGRALREIGERKAALTRPLAESEKRIEALKQAAALAERSLGDLAYLLTAEQNRLHGIFAERQELFDARAVTAARAELERTIRTLAVRSRSGRWREAHRVAQDIYRRLLEAWRAEEQPIAEAMYRTATQRFVDLANDFLTQIAAEGALPPPELPPVLASERGFRIESRLYFTELMYLTTRSPSRWLTDLFRLPKSFMGALDRHALDYLEHLIVTNATRLTSDLDEQVLESRRRLEHDLRERIRDIYQVAERALERAQAQMQRGTAATHEELARLTAARVAIQEILPVPREAP